MEDQCTCSVSLLEHSSEAYEYLQVPYILVPYFDQAYSVTLVVTVNPL